jgi:peptide/nickel transport system substrate-binding protein
MPLLGAASQILQFNSSLFANHLFFEHFGFEGRKEASMRAKQSIHLAGVLVLMIILLLSYQPAAGALEEVKTAATLFGNEIPIPRLEGGSANDWFLLLYDHLVGSTDDGKLSPERGLAHKWEMSLDGSIWTFYLRTGVKFHDGVELTAKDVKFSLEQIILPDSKTNNAGVFRQFIKSIEVKSPYTLVIQCKKPFLFLPEFLSDIEGLDSVVIPKDYYEKVGQDQFIRNPIGSGPYKWHSQMLGSYIKLESTGKKHWRDGVPKYKYMTFLIVPDEFTRTSMLKRGEVHIVMASRGSVKELLDAGLQVIPALGAGIACYYPNMQWTSPAFSDIRFRKALNLSIDKEAIIKHLLSGMGKPVATFPGNATTTCGGDPTLKPYPYNPEEARRLIKEGGYEGYEFNFACYPRSEYSENPDVIEAIVGYWQKIGLRPKISMTTFDAWREKMITQKTQNTVHGSESSVVPGCNGIFRSLQQKFHSKDIRTLVKIPYLDERFERALNSVDLAEVARLMGEVYRFIYDQYLAIPVCDLGNMIATTKQIPIWDPGQGRRNRNYRGLIRQQ